MSTSTVKIRTRRARRMVGVLTVLVVVAGWWFLFRPTSLGGTLTSMTVTGKSMQPTMHTGDLVLIRDSDDYAIGDVVAYRVPLEDGSQGETIIHRIVSGNAVDGFVLQGDNNSFKDPWKLRPNQITGEQWVHLPKVGAVFGELRKPVTAGAAMAALVMFLALTGGQGKKKEPRRDDQMPVSTGGTP